VIGRSVLYVAFVILWFLLFASFAVLFLMLAPRERRDDDDPGDLPRAA
jgi:hypothetical protein